MVLSPVMSVFLFAAACLACLQLCFAAASPAFNLVVTRDGMDSTGHRYAVAVKVRITSSPIPSSLLQLGEKSFIKLVVDSFSMPDMARAVSVSHFLCMLQNDSVTKCFSDLNINKKTSFVINPTKEHLSSGSYELVLYSFFISTNSSISELVHQTEIHLGKMNLRRSVDRARIYQDRLSLLGPNAWRDSCGPLPEIIPTETPRMPPKANLLLVVLFTLLVIVMPWVSLFYLWKPLNVNFSKLYSFSATGLAFFLFFSASFISILFILIVNWLWLDIFSTLKYLSVSSFISAISMVGMACS